MKHYFITGTDTDCGKTYVTCRLLRAFQSQKQTAQALKPVASGSYWKDGTLSNGDVVALQKYNSNPSLSINQWIYELPIAPHIAALQVNERFTARLIAEFCESPIFSDFEHLLVEGAGGLMVPLNDEETWLDFLQITQMPVILVVGLRLGCINHALLTAGILEKYQIKTHGWVANHIDPNMLFVDETIDFLEKKMPMPLMLTVPYEPDL